MFNYLKMSRLYIVALSLILVNISCKSSKASGTLQQIEALEHLVQKRSFQIESQWAQPQTTYAVQQVMNSGILGPGNNSGNINLIGNPNFLKIKGDSISSYLPYYGERQMNVDYGGTDSAIELDGLMSNYKVKINKDQSRTISFEAKDNNENYSIFIRLFPNLNSDMLINSSTRFPIRYSGTVENEKEQLN